MRTLVKEENTRFTSMKIYRDESGKEEVEYYGRTRGWSEMKRISRCGWAARKHWEWIEETGYDPSEDIRILEEYKGLR